MVEKIKEEPKKEEEKKPEVPEFQKKLDEMKVESERMEKVLGELKEIKAFDALSGKTDAGQPQEKKEEESPADYAKRLLSGKVELDAN